MRQFQGAAYSPHSFTDPHGGGYADVEIAEPNTLFDDFSSRQPFIKDTWMGLKGMKEGVLNIAPSKEQLAKSPDLMPKFLKEMTSAQRDAWHVAYDPRNQKYRRLKQPGLPVPEEVHGRALQPLFAGKTPADWRKDILYTYYDGGTPQARGSYNMPRHMGVRDGRYKLIHYYDYDAWELYDLKIDARNFPTATRIQLIKRCPSGSN